MLSDQKGLLSAPCVVHAARPEADCPPRQPTQIRTRFKSPHKGRWTVRRAGSERNCFGPAFRANQSSRIMHLLRLPEPSGSSRALLA